MAWLARLITTPTRLAVAILASFGVVLGCAVAAGELLELAQRPDGSTAFDSSITSWMVAHRTQGLTTVAKVLSTVGSQTVLIPVAAVVALALLGRRRYVAAGLLVVAWSGAIGLYSLAKHLVQRMRPPTDIWLTDVGRSSSFPSGHATQSLATFTALALVAAVFIPRRRWIGPAIALVLGIGVGWSRVYLGVHWTTDVAAGWLIAAVWLAIVVWLARTARAMRIERARETQP
jgi:undecaprenyl-diphosphatase